MTQPKTEPSPVSPLLAKLEAFVLDDPEAALPFSGRLARDNGWDPAYARRVVREYRRFVFLAMEAGHPVTPSEEVDQAWHLHLVYTRSYWEDMCGALLGRPLHHGPTRGGAAEGAKFHDWYTATLESYRRLIREEPPADIWPGVRERFAAGGRQRWVDRRRHWIVRKPRWSTVRNGLRRAALPCAVAAVAAAAWFGLSGCMPAGQAAFQPGDLFSGAFILPVLAIITAVWIFSLLRREKEKLAGAPDSGPPREIDVCELAWLQGGGRRAMIAAAAGLLTRQNAEVQKTKITRGPQNPDEELLPLELSLYHCLDDRRKGRTWKSLREHMRVSLEYYRRRLAGDGLLTTGGARFMAAFRLGLAALLGLLALWFTANVIYGPDAFTMPVTLVPALAVTIALMLAKRLPHITTAGRRAAADSSLRLSQHESGSPASAMYAVAMYGDSALLDPFATLIAKAESAAGRRWFEIESFEFGGSAVRKKSSGSRNDSGYAGGGCGTSGCGASGCGASGCGTSGCGSSGGGSSGCGGGCGGS